MTLFSPRCQVAGGRLVEMVDCSTQTRDILYDSGLKTPARAQAQTSRLAASFRQQDQDSTAGEPSAEVCAEGYS